MFMFEMTLEGTNAYSRTEKSLSTTRAGELLVDYLDVDWEYLRDESYKKLRADCNERVHAEEYCKWYQSIHTEFSKRHPLLQVWDDDFMYKMTEWACDDSGQDVREKVKSISKKVCDTIPRSFCDEGLRRLQTFFAEQGKLKKRIELIVIQVLDEEGPRSELSKAQRYRLLRAYGEEYKLLAQELNPTLRVTTYVSIDGKIVPDSGRVGIEGNALDEITPEELELMKKEKPQLHCYWETGTLAAMVLREVDHLAENEISVRHCKRCGRWFLPVSVTNRYCDREDPDHPGKTCRDLGAMSSYQKSVNESEAKKLYNRVVNRHQTWLSRNPTYYADGKERYQRWKTAARGWLNDTMTGAMPFEEFSERIDKSTKDALREF